MRLRCSRGQASVETIALLPLVVVVALAVLHVLAARGTADQAVVAAQQAAVALQRGGDAQEAAARALPSVPASRMSVAVAGRRVTVSVRPRAVVPGVGALLARSASADAGPAPQAPRSSWLSLRGGDGSSAVVAPSPERPRGSRSRPSRSSGFFGGG